VSVPAVLSENYLLSSSAAVTIITEDYVAAKTILAASVSWKNNLLAGLQYRPGSGLDADGFAVGQSLFIGNRVPTLTFTALLTHLSDEYAKLIAQTTGTVVLTLTFDATHFVTWTWEKVSFEMVERTQEEGLVAVTVTCAPQFDAVNGVLQVTSKNAITDIAQ